MAAGAACRDAANQLCGLGELKAIAATDRSYFQVKCGVLWVAALIEEIRVGLMRRDDADQGLIALLMLAEMGAEPALTILNGLHESPHFSIRDAAWVFRCPQTRSYWEDPSPLLQAPCKRSNRRFATPLTGSKLPAVSDRIAPVPDWVLTANIQDLLLS